MATAEEPAQEQAEPLRQAKLAEAEYQKTDAERTIKLAEAEELAAAAGEEPAERE